MAIQTFEKEYHVDTATETIGYNALVADMTDWYNWDEIDTESTENATIFKKFQPGSTEKWVGIKVVRSTSLHGLNMFVLSHNGTTLYQGSYGVFGTGNNKLRYAAIVLTDEGFLLLGAAGVLPSTQQYGGQYVGMYACTNRITGAAGFCAVAISANGGSDSAIMGDSTTDGTMTGGAITTKQGFNDFVCYFPIVGPYTKDVPDDIVRLIYRPDSYTACLQNVTIDGKNYIRLGDILIPE